MATSDDILEAVLSLQEEEQLLLVEQFLDRFSPEADESEIDDLAAELERRQADFDGPGRRISSSRGPRGRAFQRHSRRWTRTRAPPSPIIGYNIC
jgi:plasmid stabilization system protein ParE